MCYCLYGECQSGLHNLIPSVLDVDDTSERFPQRVGFYRLFMLYLDEFPVDELFGRSCVSVNHLDHVSLRVGGPSIVQLFGRPSRGISPKYIGPAGPGRIYFLLPFLSLQAADDVSDVVSDEQRHRKDERLESDDGQRPIDCPEHGISFRGRVKLCGRGEPARSLTGIHMPLVDLWPVCYLARIR